MTQLKLRSDANTHDLVQRHHVEETFHDDRAYVAAPPARTDFYPQWMGDEHFQILLKTAGSLTGKRVLDFGCGRGQTSRFYCRQGALRVEGFDISGANISIAEKNARREGVDDRVFFRRLAAEDIDYPDGSFDLIIGKAILHHTDLEKTAKQLHRVLSPNGVAIFFEPLSHNPVLNLFRRLTPGRRTPTEKPLAVQDLRQFRGYFASVTYRGFYLLTILSHALLFITGSRKLFASSRAMLRKWEEPLLVGFPRLQKYCWSAVLVFRKSESAISEWPEAQIAIALK